MSPIPPPYRKTLNITSWGIRLSTSGNARAMLSIWPVLPTRTLMPEALPRCRAATVLINALTFGELNSPEPPPMRIIYTARTQ